jgi:hypothetical protein
MAIFVSYLDIQDSIAIGTAWRASTFAPYNNVDSGNNVSWRFGKILKDFFPFLNLQTATENNALLSIPRLIYVDIKDGNATGETWIATTSTGNVNSGNNIGFDFTSNLTIG